MNRRLKRTFIAAAHISHESRDLPVPIVTVVPVASPPTRINGAPHQTIAAVGGLNRL